MLYIYILMCISFQVQLCDYSKPRHSNCCATHLYKIEKGLSTYLALSHSDIVIRKLVVVRNKHFFYLLDERVHVIPTFRIENV